MSVPEWCSFMRGLQLVRGDVLNSTFIIYVFKALQNIYLRIPKLFKNDFLHLWELKPYVSMH